MWICTLQQNAPLKDCRGINRNASKLLWQDLMLYSKILEKQRIFSTSIFEITVCEFPDLFASGM
jgi:hypothetical protein